MNPDTFETTLNRRMGQPYGLAYRLIESHDGQSWLIEQKLSPGQVVETNTGDPDVRRRMSDHYGLVLKTLKHPYYRCKSCHMTHPAPTMSIAEVKCHYCAAGGERSIYFLGHFPLVDRLLTYIERTHPKRGEAWEQEMKRENAAQLRATDRDAANALESILIERHSSIVGIPRAYLGDRRPY